MLYFTYVTQKSKVFTGPTFVWKVIEDQMSPVARKPVLKVLDTNWAVEP